MSVVFLSHSHLDGPFARRLAKDLESQGIRTWVDEAELLVGDSLIERIGRAIDEAEYVAVILSANSVSSPWVQRELDIAMNQEIRNRRVKVLPLLVSGCVLPPFLLGKVFADFRDPARYDEMLRRIVRSVSETRDADTAARAILRRAVADWTDHHIPLDLARLRLIASSSLELSLEELELLDASVSRVLQDVGGLIPRAVDRGMIELKGHDPDLDEVWETIHVCRSVVRRFSTTTPTLSGYVFPATRQLLSEILGGDTDTRILFE